MSVVPPPPLHRAKPLGGLVVLQRAQPSAAERTLLYSEAESIIKEIGVIADTGRGWEFRKGERLIDIGLLLDELEYIDYAWLFLGRLKKL